MSLSRATSRRSLSRCNSRGSVLSAWDDRTGGSPKGQGMFETTTPLHARSVLATLYDMMFNGKLCDLRLRVGVVEFPCHRAVVCAASPHIYELIQENCDEEELRANGLRLRGFDPNVFRLLLDYMYTGRLQVAPDGVADVATASHKLGMETIRDQCVEFLMMNIDPDDAINLLTVAGVIENKELEERAYEMVREKLSSIVESEEYVKLGKDQMVGILNSDLLELDEDVVFKIYVVWVTHDEAERGQYAAELFDCIRLPLMDEEFIYNTVSEEGILKTHVTGVFRKLSLAIEWARATNEDKKNELAASMPTSHTRPRKKKVLDDFKVAEALADDDGMSVYSMAQEVPVAANGDVNLNSSADLVEKENGHLGDGKSVAESVIVGASDGQVISNETARQEEEQELERQKIEIQQRLEEEAALLHQKEMEEQEKRKKARAEAAQKAAAAAAKAAEEAEKERADKEKFEQLFQSKSEKPHEKSATPVPELEPSKKEGLGSSAQESSSSLQSAEARQEPAQEQGLVEEPEPVKVSTKIAIVGADPKDKHMVVYVYSSGDNSWENLPVSKDKVIRSQPGICAVDSKLYVLGGKDVRTRKTLETFERLTLTSKKWTALRSMKSPRSRPWVFHVDGTVYAVGAYRHGRTGLVQLVEYHNIKDGLWTNIEDLGTPRSSAVPALHQNKLYLIAGESTAGDKELFNSVICIDHATKGLADCPSLNMPRKHANAVSVGDCLYVLGGIIAEDSGRQMKIDYTADMEVLTGNATEWKACAPMRTPRHSFALAGMHGYVYVVGGFLGLESVSGRSPTLTGVVERFDSNLNKWSEIGSLKYPRRDATIISTENDGLYIIGGQDEKGSIISVVERYDEDSGWSVVGELPESSCDPLVAATL